MLASVDQLDENAPLPAGLVLEVRCRVALVPAGPEPLVTIAQQYLGDPHQADLLRRYNALDHDTLDKGEAIDMPVPNVEVRKLPPLEADAQQRRDKAGASERAVRMALRAGHAR